MRAALVVTALVFSSALGACGRPGHADPTRPSAGPRPSVAATTPSAAPTVPTPPSAPDPLDVAPNWAAFERVPKLPRRVAKDAYAYFRFINSQFSSVVCADLADFAGSAPSVPLHGDAHLEQYALTDIGRGLTDFDDMATGPAVIDLARMTTSLVLVARMRSFSDDAAVDAFIGGYREGLAGRDAPRPSIIAELARLNKRDPKGFLEGAERMMLSVTEDPTLDEAQMRRTLDELERAMRAHDATIPPWFFIVKKLGPFHAGIGSSLDRKFLARLEGMTKDPLDDRVIELKFVGDRKLAPCVKRRLEHEPTDLRADIPLEVFDRFLVPTFVGTSEAWAQEWYPNFHEVESETVTEVQLAEVARDAGSLLAREHVRGASPQNLAIDQARNARLLSASKALATRVEVAWKKFRDGLPPLKEAK
jgi:hypothetical protein